MIETTWCAQVLRYGELLLADKRYWSPECAVLKRNSRHEVQAHDDDWLWVEILRPGGGRIRADLIGDSGFVGEQAARQIARRHRGMRASVRSQMAREAADSEDILHQLGLHLRILPDLIDRAMAQVIARTEREAARGHGAHASTPTKAEGDDYTGSEPLPEFVPVEALSSRGEGCPQCGYCPERSEAGDRSPPSRSSGEADPDLPAQEAPSSEELPAQPSAQIHRTTCCLRSCCCCSKRRCCAEIGHCLSEVAK